ncbi:MAG: cyanophycin synthetase, partial [Buchnera aphidicola]|nr:cyanophycin synthetase [Buchnera aphidicola]
IIKKSLAQIKLYGRFQILSYFPYIILDVAHNPDASLYLFKKIDNLSINGKIYVIMGCLKDKDALGIISPFK